MTGKENKKVVGHRGTERGKEGRRWRGSVASWQRRPAARSPTAGWRGKEVGEGKGDDNFVIKT